MEGDLTRNVQLVTHVSSSLETAIPPLELTNKALLQGSESAQNAEFPFDPENPGFMGSC